MTDWPQLIVSLGTFIGSCAAAYASVMAVRSSRDNRTVIGQVRQDVAMVKDNVVTIEKATNSMKDALVEATQKAGEAKGRDDMRAEQKAEATDPATLKVDQIVTDKIVTKD